MIVLLEDVQSIGDFWSFVSDAISCFYESFKVLLSTLMILKDNIGSQTWMPDVILNIGILSLTLIVLLRILGR